MSKRVIWFVLAAIIILLLLSKVINSAGVKNNPVMPKKIALIQINGEISDTTHILELLNEFNDMPQVKAIVLRVNSPGGGVSASQEVFEQIKKVRANGKFVVVSMGDMAASGAYYISSAADKIYANKGTLTGSIGVIINFMNAEKLLGKVGVNFTTIKSGKYKDTGSFSRPVNEADKAIMSALINDVLNQFVDDVISVREVKLAKGFGIFEKSDKKRQIEVKKYMLANIADGRVFTGLHAKDLGLVDEIGSIDDAIEGAASLIGLHGRPMVISEKEKQGFGPWLDSKIAGINPAAASSMVLLFKAQ